MNNVQRYFTLVQLLALLMLVLTPSLIYAHPNVNVSFLRWVAVGLGCIIAFLERLKVMANDLS